MYSTVEPCNLKLSRETKKLKIKSKGYEFEVEIVERGDGGGFEITEFKII